MRIAFLTDLHLRDDRLAEQVAALDIACNDIDFLDPDLIVIGGDLAGMEVPHRSTPAERNALVKLVLALSQTAAVVVVRGNHDVPGDYAFLNELAGLNAIVYVESPELVNVGDHRVLCLPWLDRSRFPMAADYGDAVRATYQKAVEESRAQLIVAGGAGAGRVLVCHGAVRGGSIRDGQPVVPTSDPLLDLDTLLPPKLFDIALFGHYHAAQQLPNAGLTPAYYGGSVFVNEYGESGEGHGWCMYEAGAPSAKGGCVVDRGEMKQVPRIVVHLDATARTVTKVQPPEYFYSKDGAKTKLDEGTIAVLCAPKPHIKIVATIAEGDGPALAWLEKARNTMLTGPEKARSVRMDLRTERVVRLREGATTVAEAATLGDKVQAFFAATTIDAPAKVQEQALAQLASIEAALEGAL